MLKSTSIDEKTALIKQNYLSRVPFREVNFQTEVEFYVVVERVEKKINRTLFLWEIEKTESFFLILILMVYFLSTLSTTM